MNCVKIDNKIVAENKALISVKERGFLFGDGVFETCRIFDKKIYNWQAHLKRLEAGLQAVKIKAKINDLEEQAAELIAKNSIKEGILRIYISRGIGSSGYLPSSNMKPLIVIETKALPSLPKAPISLWVSKTTKPSANSLPVNYKLAQGLNSTLARIEAVDNDCFDSLLLNDLDQICETSSANIFWVKNDILYTPDENCGLLLGTVRQRIIELSLLKVVKVKAKLKDLLLADEVFITNVSFGVLAIDNIMPNNYSFINRKYGKIYADLLNKDIISYVAQNN